MRYNAAGNTDENMVSVQTRGRSHDEQVDTTVAICAIPFPTSRLVAGHFSLNNRLYRIHV
jgi:hypothetical protein